MVHQVSYKINLKLWKYKWRLYRLQATMGWQEKHGLKNIGQLLYIRLVY